MDFRSYKNEKKEPKTESANINREDVLKTAESYKDKSETELLNDILKLAKEQKSNGALSDENLKSFSDSVSPMLNEEQRKRLETVLSMLKN